MNAIVTTTINEPTEALLKFSKLPNWKLYVVGDHKTPNTYKTIENIVYLSPEYQQEYYGDLSNLIGWNCIQRRNIGLIEAFRSGAEIIATVDDDNIPYDNWGEKLLVGNVTEIDCYENEKKVFDPLSITNISHFWHRGYPIELLSTRLNNRFIGKIKTKILVQADLWDGDPDIDAMCRLMGNSPNVKISGNFPFTSSGIAIFNSQNTFLHRSIVPLYSVLAHADRMDDIWGGIILQRLVSGIFVAFNKPSVCQRRNYHNIINDLEREIPGYYKTNQCIQNWEGAISAESLKFFKLYRKYYENRNYRSG